MNFAKAAGVLLQLDIARIKQELKSRWMGKTFPAGSHYRDEVARFDRLYLVSDPWTMESEREKYRFRETNRLITKNFGHPHSVLEIGCGEGAQSSELQSICDHVYGIDISKRAVSRAKRRCPEATFAVCDMYSILPPAGLKRFDLVIACEVLFYMSDIAGALKRMSELGHACLVSYYHIPRAELDKHVSEMKGAQFNVVSYEDVSWTFAWWRP